ncbi:MAG: ClpXP protease specificity-enhancing factor SspB [Rhizobiaceae bacterium]
MSEDLIRYDILAQEALRSVIQKVLEEVERAGLPGEHHFFITFLTGFPGVRVSTRMRERYPDEMTIVIQHTYWNLKVTDQAFEIDLSFDDIRERLRIPFAAVRGFFDPSVKFGLQFDVAEVEAAGEPEAGKKKGPAAPASVPSVKPRAVPSPGADVSPVTASKVAKPDARSTPAKSGAKVNAKAPAGASPKADGDKKGAEVVSLDSFRKKK